MAEMIELAVGQKWQVKTKISKDREYIVIQSVNPDGSAVAVWNNSHVVDAYVDAVNQNFTLMQAEPPQIKSEPMVAVANKKEKSEGDRMMDFFAGKKTW